MDKKKESLKALDWFKVLDFIQGFATSELGQDRIKNLTPFSHSKEALNHLKRVEVVKTHFKDFLNARSIFFRPNMKSIDSYSSWKTRLQKGVSLNPLELVKVRNFLEDARSLKHWLNSSNQIELKGVGENILKVSKLLSSIDRIITEEGEIKVDASPLLFELYRQKNKNIQKIKNLLDQFIRDHKIQSLLQERFVTTREGRWVLPIKSGMKMYFKGVVHARSQTHQTVFMEPQEVLEFNNEVQQIEQAIEDEISSLLKKISRYLYSFQKDFQQTKNILLEYDLFIAFAMSSLVLKTHAFQFDVVFDVFDLRHIWLFLSELKKNSTFHFKDRSYYKEENLLRKKVIPNDLELNQKKRILLLSGVNAGGKTVFLKAIGSAALMAQCGLPIMAKEGSRIPFFKNIRILIHDLQNVEEQTSRFSSHLMELNDWTEFKGSEELFLIDEICTSTDPEEGSALGKSFIESFAKQGVYAVITSHFQTLKEGWPLSSGVFNGSFEFDLETGPSYKFLPFQAGRSFALKFAEKIGVGLKIIKRAKRFLSPSYRAYLREHKKNENHYEEIKELKRNWQREVEKVEKKAKEYEKALKKLEREKEEKLLKVFKNAEKKIEELMLEAKKEKVQVRFESLKKLKSSLPEIVKIKPKKKNFFPKSIEEFKKRFPPGSLVYVPHLRSEATLQEGPNRKGEVTILSNSLRLSLPWNQLGFHPEAFFKKSSPLSKYVDQESRKDFSSEGDLSQGDLKKKVSFKKKELSFFSSTHRTSSSSHLHHTLLKRSDFIRVLKRRKNKKVTQEKGKKRKTHKK